MISTEPTALIPVTLLTGFLGSGKTTVLNHVLKQPGMAATAVIVNEFGEIGLDHLLVERSSEDVVLLNSGCLCCTVRGDIVAKRQLRQWVTVYKIYDRKSSHAPTEMAVTARPVAVPNDRE
jgi:Ni2+-binding GTPase involved in maturation of urease and hydrogenase